MSFLENLIWNNNEEEKEALDEDAQEEATDESSDENFDEEEKSEKKDKPASDIEDLRNQVVNAYLARLNKKDFVKWLLRGKGIKSAAREYILAPQQAEEDIDFSWLNLPPEIAQFATALKGWGSSLVPSLLQKFTGVSVGYDEVKELNPMRELMAKTEYQTDAKALEDLKKSIKSWTDVATLLAAPVVVWTGVVAANSTNSSSTAPESSNLMNLKAEGIDKYFTVLTGSTDVGIHNANARKTIETMNIPCTFFEKNLTVNKYVVPKLQEVEKEIKDSGID